MENYFTFQNERSYTANHCFSKTTATKLSFYIVSGYLAAGQCFNDSF